MPRQYISVSELQTSPYGIGLTGQLAQLGTGVIDKLIFRASERIDDLCKKRIGAPQNTILSGAASSGSTMISVASTLGFDNKAEQAVILDVGSGIQETVQVMPGGVIVTDPPAYPYPGTINLASGLQFSHALNASVTGCYQEVREAGSASSGDPYTEALQSQAAQLALAHLPIRHAGLTRVVQTKQCPIISIFNIEHAYSYDVNYNPLAITSMIIEPNAGYYRFMVGMVVLPEGMIRTTYIAGYQTVPDDIKHATVLLVADQMTAFTNPYGALETQMGKRRYKFNAGSGSEAGKSYLVLQAEEICKAYKRTA